MSELTCSPVKWFGEPIYYANLEDAGWAAARLNKENSRVGRDHCRNLHYEPGWMGAEE